MIARSLTRRIRRVPRYVFASSNFSEPRTEQLSQYFVCGTTKVARGIKETLTAIIKEARGVDDVEAAAMFERASTGRYATDIFE